MADARRARRYPRVKRYPVFRTVWKWRGFAGSISSFRRSSMTCMSTVRDITSEEYPQISRSSCERVTTSPGEAASDQCFT